MRLLKFQLCKAGSSPGNTNAEFPAWLRFSGEERVCFESLDGVSFKPAGNDYLLQRLRLNLNLTLLPGLKFSFQAQDSRAPTPAEHFHGLYGSIEKLIPGAMIEPYLFWNWSTT